MTLLDQFAIWRRTLAPQSDELDSQREVLRQSFLQFRERTAQLVGEIAGLLPGLTVHDITHLDGLWRVADEIAGPDYPLNPAEAFVLGGAILLHDAAHVLVAYEDGLPGIKRTVEWKDLVAQRFGNNDPATGSPEERSALFQVLRDLHARQARRLPEASCRVPSSSARLHLLENFQLRDYYGDLIGEIAESHHWPAHRVASTFKYRHLSAPSFLTPAKWSVDALKVAFLLRTSDAAHIDAQRAPWFLFALRNPDAISQPHWQFQAKMGQPLRTPVNELRLSSGNSFDPSERQAWWLAYDTACMIDRELRDAQTLMRDTGRTPFATTSVEHARTPEDFATNVRTADWEPVNVAPKIGDVPKVIGMLGGTRLYGNRPELALRELIQNAADAVRALRSLGVIGQKEGYISVALKGEGDLTWLHVTDTGVGMSRYVLTEVLLDFGNSLWSSESLLTELPGLASKGFRSVGLFGIGFFAVFMLGSKVAVTTRRFDRAGTDDSDQWLLEFIDGLAGRPTLRRPTLDGGLKRPGTRVSIGLDLAAIKGLEDAETSVFVDALGLGPSGLHVTSGMLKEVLGQNKQYDLRALVSTLCPTLDVNVEVTIDGDEPTTVIAPDDWQFLKSDQLLKRLYPGGRYWNPKPGTKLLDIKELSGELVGRVGYAGSFHHAVVTHRGLRSGTVPKLVGVLLGHNNADLARRESRPIASPEAWRKWANEWLGEVKAHNIETLSDLHSLCPERDLPVYRIAGSRINQAKLLKWLKEQSEIRAYFEGQPEHEDYDEVSKDNFQQNLKLNEEILFLPRTDGALAKSLGLPAINYVRRLEKALHEAWGEFDEYEDNDVEVGSVYGVDIIRSVTWYTRAEQSK